MSYQPISGTSKPAVAPRGDDIRLDDVAPTEKRKDLSPAEAAEMLQILQQFESGLNNAATQGVPEPEPDTGARSDGVSGMNSALDNAQTNLATDIYAFMAMYTKLAHQMRATAREQRQNELQGQVSALNSAADKMVEAAEKRFDAALVQGITQIVSGAISIASGAYTLGKMAAASRPQVDLPESSPSKADAPLPEGFSRPRANAMTSETMVKPATTTSTPLTSASDPFAPGSKLSLELQAKQGLFTGSAQVASGSGTMLSASMEKDAAESDSDAKRNEALSSKAQADREVQQDIVQSMGELLRDIREQLRAMAQAEVESNKGMARNI